MRRSHHTAMFLAATLCAAICGGCDRTENAKPGAGYANRTTGKTPEGTRPAGQAKSGKKTGVRPAKKNTAPPPPPLAMPAVNLSEQDERNCKIKVGDPLPAMKLTDLAGKAVEGIGPLMGEKATVVVFWNAANPYAVEQFTDLGEDVAQPYAGQGIRVITIHIGEVTEEVRSLAAGPPDIKFAVLIDPNSASLPLLAAGDMPRMPRTYVLDSEGNVLWFDIEYSRTTRTKLSQVLEVLSR